MHELNMLISLTDSSPVCDLDISMTIEDFAELWEGGFAELDGAHC
jgi:hypothetical protein